MLHFLYTFNPIFHYNTLYITHQLSIVKKKIILVLSDQHLQRETMDDINYRSML